jgi:glycosyltransferase involved in cell wall biosynthesis
MKILVDCRCLNYPFLTGVNAYTIRFLHCLSIIKFKNPNFKLVSMGIKNYRLRELMSQFPFLLDLFESHISLAKYLGHQDSHITNSNWFHKFLEIGLITKNWVSTNLNNNQIEKYDYVILPQPRLLNMHPDSKLITIFHDIFSVLNNHKQLPQSLIFNKHTCQTLVNRSHKVIAGSNSTCQDINKTFFGQNNFSNPKIQLLYPALPNLQKLQITELSKKKNLTEVGNSPLEGWQSQTDGVDQSDVPQININNYTQNIFTKPYILAISGIEPRKNWQNLLLAHKYLQEKYNWDLILVLSGSVVDQKYYSNLLQVIKSNDIQNVVWQLNITEIEKNKLISDCEFVVYPSFYEGFGFPILEAFKHNKVVITSRISSMPEIGKGGCIYANPFSFTSIANCIYLLSRDKEFKNTLETNIPNIKSQYSWNRMTHGLEQVLI